MLNHILLRIHIAVISPELDRWPSLHVNHKPFCSFVVLISTHAAYLITSFPSKIKVQESALFPAMLLMNQLWVKFV